MIITLIVLLVLDMIIIAALAWERRQTRISTSGSAPLPTFIREAQCVRCGKSLTDDDRAVETHMRAAVGNKLLPVTAKTCEECVASA